MKMPVLFVGHGNPMNALEDNEFSRAWTEVGLSLPGPEAILCISAHWETEGTRVTAMNRPKTIHDFYGFPQQLYEMAYPAPGSPELARLLSDSAAEVPIRPDFDWGLDHGTWSVLCRMFPDAGVPVVQLSLDRTKGPAFHYELAGKLRDLRNKGILIIGSGNLVHNLRMINWEKGAYDWASEFDDRVRQLILAGDHDSLIHYEKLGRTADLAIPTNEHYLPLLYVLALRDKTDDVAFFSDKVTLGSISMRSVRIG